VEVGVDLPHIEGILDAKIGVKPSSASNSTVTFTGPVPVTFGFAVQEIARTGDCWTLRGAAPSADIAFGVWSPAGEAEEDSNPLVFDTGEFECRLDL
jgi:hypothetical protein